MSAAEERPSSINVPRGSCDTHFHVFGSRSSFPYTSERSYTPFEAPVGCYRACVMDNLGIDRCVVVQPSIYGTDNSCTLEAMRALGAVCRGVIALDGRAVTDGELERLASEGVRGVRINVLFRGGVSLERVATIARRIRPLGWHVQLLMDVRGLTDKLVMTLRDLGVPIVFDHMGHIPAAAGQGDSGFGRLLAALDEGWAWAKLSGAYRVSKAPFPYPDVTPLARALISAAPNQLIWGSDWPHPAVDVPVPSASNLLELLGTWTTDQKIYRKILVDNPALLYGFPQG